MVKSLFFSERKGREGGSKVKSEEVQKKRCAKEGMIAVCVNA